MRKVSPGYERPKVGQIVYKAPVRELGNTKPEQVEVIRVGNKYFYCFISGMACQFRLDTWIEKVDGSPIWQVYPNPELIELRRAREKLGKELHEVLTYQLLTRKLCLSQLQAIKAIIGEQA